MENHMRDNLKSGEGNLTNRAYGKDSMLPNDDNLCKHPKQIEWNYTGLCVYPEKALHQFISL